MFVPPTYKAETLNFTDEQLDAPGHQCLCGNDVKLRDCIVCWTHHPNNDNYGWFAACQGQCITAHISEGSA